ncbi:MAG: c-type cytochrome [Gammaproteobacteria bacterium]|nr:c-type cytochrome [Gammaproteobacteria bacterium]
MRPFPGMVCFFIALTLSCVGHAQDSMASLFKPCAYCHGSEAQGNPVTAAPALAGQDAAYLERQLWHFKQGVRGADSADVHGMQMAAMAQTLSDDNIPAMAKYLSAMPAPTVTAAADADLRNGSNYYHASCGACHGAQAQGNPALNAPALSALDQSYLLRQMANFQKGIRGSHPDDRYGRQMKMMSSALPDEKTLLDVIAFIHRKGSVPQQ